VLAECDAAIEQARSALGPSAGVIRWVRSEGIHLTLKFLGSVPTSTVPAVVDRLSTELRGVPPFELALGGLGVFPNARRPKVLWLSVLGEIDALRGAQERVEVATVPLGFPRENRPFRPHLTLGRVRDTATTPELDALDRLPLSIPLARRDRVRVRALLRSTFRVTSVSLMQSRLAPDGARYTRLAQIPFDTD
jgi:2'-5' RNA ligase